MTAKGKDPEALLGLAIEMLKSEIQPALPADKRYAAAMLANALEIAMRAVAVEEDAPTLAVLDHFYEDGDGTAEQLARDIREGRITDATHGDLGRRLRALVVGELKVRNPRLLAARGIKG
jgi:hypothetical protein